MPTYVSLIHWTEQGIKNYKDTTKRLEDFTKLAESMGGRVREALYTVGEYDIVIVTEFPDDEAATAALLQVGSLGSVRTNTMRAFMPTRWAASLAGPANAVTSHPGLWHQAFRPAAFRPIPTAWDIRGTQRSHRSSPRGSPQVTDQRPT